MKTLDDVIADIVISEEVDKAKRNQKPFYDTYESAIDMFECKRTEFKAKWMSDIFLPEYPSHVLTDTAMFAVQYFQRRDFVECYMMDESDEAQRMAEAAKECINRTLNRKDLYYFQKLTRARMIARAAGYVYLVCRWEEKYLPIKETRRKTVPIMDDMGTPIAMDVREEEVEIESKEIDHFNFEVFDPRNVFTDDTFTYSANQKPWITLRYEKTYDELKAQEEDMGYINLDKVKKLMPPAETDTSLESVNKNVGQAFG